jgi:L-fuconolactonase
MPSFPIIDTHLHLWHPQRLSYGWLTGNQLLNRPYLVEDYQQACAGVDVGAAVFLESQVDPGLLEEEVRFVEEQGGRDPRVKGLVAQARLEDGAHVLPFLEGLRRSTPLLRGIRRIIESEPELEFCLKSEFIEGVRLLAPLGLPFEITVNYRHLETLLRFVDRVGQVALILDHCGKPRIRDRELEPWRTQIRTLAAQTQVKCKLSGLMVEADHRHWSEEQLRPYIDAVVEAFGFQRLLFGSDWPVCLQAGTLPQWVALLDRALAGVDSVDLKCFYRNNAIDFYRLDVPRL